MGGRGFEPPRVAPIAPKAIASANFAIRPDISSPPKTFAREQTTVIKFIEPPATRTRHNHIKSVVLYLMS